MMYSEFKEAVKDHILDFMPEEYQTAQVSLSEVSKTNGIKHDSLMVKKEGSNACPACYLDDLFSQYENLGDFATFMDKLAVSIHEQYENAPTQLDVNDFAKLDYVRKNIFPEAINKDANEELLGRVPSIEIADLAVIFRVRVDSDKSFIINDDIAALYETDAKDLFEIAKDNSNEHDSYYCIGLNEKFSEMGFAIPGASKGEEDMYILTNDSGLYGAGCIVFPEFIEAVEEYIGEPFYILPSSLHELLAVPASKVDDVGALEEIVEQVNKGYVNECDKLSDNVYMYNPQSRSIEVCHETIGLEQHNGQESSISVCG